MANKGDPANQRSRIFLESKSEKFFQTRTLPFRPGGEEGGEYEVLRTCAIYAMRLVGIPLVYAKIAVHKPQDVGIIPIAFTSFRSRDLMSCDSTSLD